MSIDEAPGSIDAAAAGSGPAVEQSRWHWVLGDPADDPEGTERANPLGLVVLVALFGLLWYAGLRYFLVVVGLLVMIVLHELGHFITARRTGMKVTQFFLFFGPRIFSVRRGETEYGLRMIPLGAFVRIVGMTNIDPVEPGDEARAYRAKSYPRRMLVITAGSMMHFLQALVLFVVLASVIGQPDDNKWSIGEISMLATGETPAVTAGLQPGDTITSVDGTPTTNYLDLQGYMRARPGETVHLEVVRNGTTSTVAATLATRELTDGQIIGFLGVAPHFDRARQNPLVGVKAFGYGMADAVTMIPRFLSPSTFLHLGELLFQGTGDVSIDSKEAADRPVSMIGVVRIAGAPEFDWTMPVSMLAYINIFVGVFNLLPLLPLDGGHAAIATYERLRSRRGRRYHVDITKLLPLTYAVVLVLGFLMLTTVLLDIVRPIS